MTTKVSALLDPLIAWAETPTTSLHKQAMTLSVDPAQIGAGSWARAHRTRLRRHRGRAPSDQSATTDSRTERGIVFIWPPAPTVIRQAQLATVGNAIAARIQLAPIGAGPL
jgi:hypothetical protein